MPTTSPPRNSPPQCRRAGRWVMAATGSDRESKSASVVLQCPLVFRKRTLDASLHRHVASVAHDRLIDAG
jgi:hypothetical protein